jgi:hypothetical protein
MFSVFVDLFDDCLVHLESAKMKGWQSRKDNTGRLEFARLWKKLRGTDQTSPRHLSDKKMNYRGRPFARNDGIRSR